MVDRGISIAWSAAMSIKSFRQDLAAPGVRSMDVTQSDEDDLEVYPKSLWINTDGTVRGILAQDPEDAPMRTYTVVAGTPLPLVFRRISPDSTASFVAIVL